MNTRKHLRGALLAGLLALWPGPGRSQIETLVNVGLGVLGLKGGDRYGKSRLIELKKILDKNKKALGLTARLEESGQATELYTQAQLEIARSIEELMRSVRELRAIRSDDGSVRFNEMVVHRQIQQEVKSYLSGFVPARFLARLEAHLAAGTSRQDPQAGSEGEKIYALFFGRSGLDATPPENLSALGEARGQEVQHLLQYQTALQKKKLVQALLYYKLSDELYAQGQTLSEALNREDNGSALDLAARLRQRILEKMTPSSLQQLLSDPPTAGLGLDLLSGGDLSSLLGELAGGFESILEELNGEVEGFLTGLDGLFPDPSLPSPAQPNPAYFTPGPAGLRLSTGERTLLQKMAVDLSAQSVDYRRQGDRLMEEALQKTPLQQALELKRTRSYMLDSYRYLDLSL